MVAAAGPSAAIPWVSRPTAGEFQHLTIALRVRFWMRLDDGQKCCQFCLNLIEVPERLPTRRCQAFCNVDVAMHHDRPATRS